MSTSPPASDRLRVLGWVLAVVGPGISVTMALAARTLYGTVALDRLTGRSPHWHGSPGFTRVAAALLGTVFLLGAVIGLAGVYQIRTGRRNRVLVGLTLGLAAVTAFLVCGVVSSR